MFWIAKIKVNKLLKLKTNLKPLKSVLKPQKPPVLRKYEIKFRRMFLILNTRIFFYILYYLKESLIYFYNKKLVKYV